MGERARVKPREGEWETHVLPERWSTRPAAQQSLPLKEDAAPCWNHDLIAITRTLVSDFHILRKTTQKAFISAPRPADRFACGRIWFSSLMEVFWRHRAHGSGFILRISACPWKEGRHSDQSQPHKRLMFSCAFKFSSIENDAITLAIHRCFTAIVICYNRLSSGVAIRNAPIQSPWLGSYS